MKDNRLISMVEFVLSFLKDYETDDSRVLNQILRYAEFLKEPLTLGMFIPCDENDNPLENPKRSAPVCRDCADENGRCPNRNNAYCDPKLELEQYEKAKEKIFFEGFEVYLHHRYSKFIRIKNGEFEICFDTTSDSKQTIENLARSFNLTLTDTAIKQILK